ncbi:LysR family transcriptional regulator [Streptomyces sp. ID05-04B]|nr:LysR family transcriptional regulator [Streptomyces sp. ID05-04B]
MYEPSHLRAFLAVAQTLSSTQAARRLGLRRSTVGQHVRRLEDATGRTLFTRDTHSVELTEDGEAMLGSAHRILDAHDQAAAFFTGTRLRGRLPFEASENFVPTRLPEILESFRSDHPEVDLGLTVELSGTLHERLAAGKLDLVSAKRRPEDPRGKPVWHDELVWIGAERLRPDAGRPVPLIRGAESAAGRPGGGDAGGRRPAAPADRRPAVGAASARRPGLAAEESRRAVKGPAGGSGGVSGTGRFGGDYGAETYSTVSFVSGPSPCEPFFPP